MKVLVTGAQGQLGTDIVKLLRNQGLDCLACSRAELDITSMDNVRRVVHDYRPQVIIHTAAYTQVDQAESDEELAYEVNAYGTRNLAVAAEELGAKLCYISTDYVFDGTTQKPHQEYDTVNPLSVYGKSKLAGEDLTKTLCSRYYIVRTSWVYGLYGNNFVKTMLRLAEEKEELGVVHDQVGSPTYTVDLAQFLFQLIQTDKYGIYHVTNSGFCSWYEFALEIFKQADVDVKVNPLTTEEFPRPAPRPKFSVLDHLAIRANGFQSIRHWKKGLKDFITELRR